MIDSVIPRFRNRETRVTRHSKHEWPRGSGTIGNNRSGRHSVRFSMGERHARVKLLEEISLFSLLKRNFSSTTGRMDPTGFEPASATMTECRVPLTLRALIGVCGSAKNMARVAETIFWTVFQIGRLLVDIVH